VSPIGAELREQKLGALRWIVVSGPGGECFRALGEHMRAEISGAVADWPVTGRLRRHVADGPGSRAFASVRAATEAAYPDEWAELGALADGANVSIDDLALLNLRGDLGPVEGGFGCSDLAWRRGRSFIAHNEDQSASLAGQCALPTLAIDGLPRICAFWCPMFLPGNAFTITGDGLVWSIDSLTVPEPGNGAGRHFVARGLQRGARTLGAAVGYLRIRQAAVTPPRCAPSSPT
jgi:Acyl-coenzyme A:6-aminopenicillanic acid acyl-transferase